ncbi:MAG: InlB B-repeat-containing protein, partial [Oscillospiraceae bacterium]|nr:InlB B-repeat-containing protein [Oscillospiraceae bacterium]
MSKHFRKPLALLLAVLLVLGMIPTALAAPNRTEETQSAMRATGRLTSIRRGGDPAGDAIQSTPNLPAADLPSSYDSRLYGYITPVRNQGDYNTCWTFGAAACCEAYMIKHGVLVGETGQPADTSLNLSEYHLAYYTYTDAYDAEGMLTGDKTYFLSSHPAGNFLEAGGTGELVSYPLMRWTGLADESDPALVYGAASTAGLGSEHAYQNNVAHVQSVKHFFGSNIEEVKRHVMEYGAGSMGVRISNASGTAYHGGVNTANGTICWIQSAVAYQDTGFYYADHDVTVVGWDDSYAKENFNQGYRPTKDGAWIVKNSWGTDIGNDGYFYVSYEDSATCASYISFFTVENVDNFDHNYQYDGSGNYYNSEEMSTGDSIAQVFTANGNETLEAIALALYGDNTDYTLKIYTGCTTDDPSTGTLALTQTGNFDYWGYQTIYLDNPVTLTPGQRFAVVLTFSGADINVAYDTTIQEDTYYHMGLIHMTHPNTSYFKGASDNSWTNKSGDGNYRVKAFTKDVPEDPVPVTLNCVALGSVYQTVSGTAGDKIQLPATAPAADGWSFLGWVTAPVPETPAKPTFYKPGATFKLTASIASVYALYQRAEAIDAPVTYELVTSAPDTWIGKYVLAAIPQTGSTEYVLTGISAGTEGTNIENSPNGASTLFASTGITRNGTTLSNVPEQYVFEAAATNYGLSLQSVSEGSYLGSKSTGSGTAAYTFFAYPAFQEANTTWTFEIDDDEMYLKNNSAGQIPYLAVSGSFGFSLTRFGSEFKFYKQNPTENYFYSTEIYGAEHNHELSHFEAQAPTCGAAGNVEYWYCPLCGKYFSDAEARNEITQASTVLPATGNHSFGSWTTNNNGTHSRVCTVCDTVETVNCSYTDVVTPPTESSAGYTTHTCDVCGYSYTDSSVPPIGAGYTVSFSVPAGVSPVAALSCAAGESVTLPAAEAPEGYTFLGWVAEAYDNVAVQPAVILTGSYAPTADVTLLALYTYTEGGSGEASYELVATAPADWSGNYVITYGTTTSMYLMKGVVPSSNGANIENDVNAISYANAGVSLSGEVLSNVADDYVFAFAPQGEYYSIKSLGANTWLGVTTSSYLAAYTEYNESYCRWTPGPGSNASSLQNANGGTYSYLSYTSGGPKFWTSSYSNTSVRLWKGTQTGVTYWTTVIGTPAHTHVVQYFAGQAASCTSEGVAPYYYCADSSCELYGRMYADAELTQELNAEDVVLPALGHDFSVLVEELEPTCTETGVKEYKCSRCDETTLTETEALGHQPGEAVQENYVEPTAATEGGYDMVVYCQRCSAELSREHTVLPATAPIETANLEIFYSISVGTDMIMSFTTLKEKVTNYDKFWIEVVKHEPTGDKVYKYGVDQEEALLDSNQSWKARFNHIFAKEMGLNVEARVYAQDANGQVWMSPAKSTTIRDYLGGRLT